MNGDTHLHIVGLGLIGGSMAAGLRDTDYRVSGFDREAERCEKALDRGLIESVAPPDDLPSSVDGLVLAVPVPEMVPVVEGMLRGSVQPDFVTDVGSTKSWVTVQMGRLLNDRVDFVGAHPMAGSDRSGLEAADPILFENAICVITGGLSDSNHVGEVVDLWETLGALVLEMDPDRHDEVVSYVSHLPHLVAGALLHAVRNIPDFEAVALPLAAGGFRDTTRIANGDPDLWRDIFETNQDRVLATIRAFQEVLNDARDIVETGKWGRMAEWLEEAREIREAIPEKTKGLLGSLFELRILAPDRPGILAEVTGCLAEESVNITDIEVLRVREGERGTIKLGFRRREERERARKLLKDRAPGVRVL